MLKKCLNFNILQITLVALMWGPTLAHAWSDHSLGAYPALESMDEVAKAAPPQAEPLETFLQAEEEGLSKLLGEEESWARAHVPEYPPLPDGLTFKAGDRDTLRTRFLEAIRVNPKIKTPLYIQLLPGQEVGERTRISWQELTTLSKSDSMAKNTYIAIEEGTEVSALSVVSTAADEPDYGLDLGVWEDNDTDFGKRYGFGTQPFGNPKLEYGSQAPFHMGFYHEADIVYSLASFVKRTYPEYRIHLFQTLARFAFETGHDYWGWRFTGWGLHYVEDLTQPYHSCLLPGVSVSRMLWINTIGMMGFTGSKEEAVQLVSNRHLALENYQGGLLRELFATGQLKDTILEAIRDTSKDAGYGAFSDRYARDVLSKEAEDRAVLADETLEKYLPERLVSDPEYVFEVTEPEIDVRAELKAGNPEGIEGMNGLLKDLLASFGAHSRIFVKSIRAH